MAGIDKQAMLRDRMQALPGLSVRVTLQTSETPAPSTNSVDPLAARSTSASATTTSHVIRAVFYESRAALDTNDPVGNVRSRKGNIEFHPIFADRVKAAQSCTISGQPGRFRIMGVVPILGGITFKAYLESMD